MSSVMSFSEYYEILVKKTNEIRKELEDIIVCDVDDIPFLDEIKDMDCRYRAYAKVAKNSVKVSQLLSNCHFTKDAVIRVKHKLQKDTTSPPKLLTSWLRDTDCLIQELDGILLSAKCYKEGLDNLNRFYQSACYMFGSIVEVKTPI